MPVKRVPYLYSTRLKAPPNGYHALNTSRSTLITNFIIFPPQDSLLELAKEKN